MEAPAMGNYFGIILSIFGLAMAAFGFITWQRSTDTDYAKMSKTFGDVTSAMNVEKEKYQTAAAELKTFDDRLKELETRKTEVKVSLEPQKEPFTVFIADDLRAEKKPHRAAINPKNSPHKLLKPNTRAPAVNQ